MMTCVKRCFLVGIFTISLILIKFGSGIHPETINELERAENIHKHNFRNRKLLNYLSQNNREHATETITVDEKNVKEISSDSPENTLNSVSTKRHEDKVSSEREYLQWKLNLNVSKIGIPDKRQPNEGIYHSEVKPERYLGMSMYLEGKSSKETDELHNTWGSVGNFLKSLFGNDIDALVDNNQKVDFNIQTTKNTDTDIQTQINSPTKINVQALNDTKIVASSSQFPIEEHSVANEELHTVRGKEGKFLLELFGLGGSQTSSSLTELEKTLDISDDKNQIDTNVSTKNTLNSFETVTESEEMKVSDSITSDPHKTRSFNSITKSSEFFESSPFSEQSTGSPSKEALDLLSSDIGFMTKHAVFTNATEITETNTAKTIKPLLDKISEFVDSRKIEDITETNADFFLSSFSNSSNISPSVSDSAETILPGLIMFSDLNGTLTEFATSQPVFNRNSLHLDQNLETFENCSACEFLGVDKSGIDTLSQNEPSSTATAVSRSEKYDALGSTFTTAELEMYCVDLITRIENKSKLRNILRARKSSLEENIIFEEEAAFQEKASSSPSVAPSDEPTNFFINLLIAIAGRNKPTQTKTSAKPEEVATDSASTSESENSRFFNFNNLFGGLGSGRSINEDLEENMFTDTDIKLPSFVQENKNAPSLSDCGNFFKEKRNQGVFPKPNLIDIMAHPNLQSEYISTTIISGIQEQQADFVIDFLETNMRDIVAKPLALGEASSDASFNFDSKDDTKNTFEQIFKELNSRQETTTDDLVLLLRSENEFSLKNPTKNVSEFFIETSTEKIIGDKDTINNQTQERIFNIFFGSGDSRNLISGNIDERDKTTVTEEAKTAFSVPARSEIPVGKEASTVTSNLHTEDKEDLKDVDTFKTKDAFMSSKHTSTEIFGTNVLNEERVSVNSSFNLGTAINEVTATVGNLFLKTKEPNEILDDLLGFRTADVELDLNSTNPEISDPRIFGLLNLFGSGDGRELPETERSKKISVHPECVDDCIPPEIAGSDCEGDCLNEFSNRDQNEQIDTQDEHTNSAQVASDSTGILTQINKLSDVDGSHEDCTEQIPVKEFENNSDKLDHRLLTVSEDNTAVTSAEELDTMKLKTQMFIAGKEEFAKQLDSVSITFPTPIEENSATPEIKHSRIIGTIFLTGSGDSLFSDKGGQINIVEEPAFSSFIPPQRRRGRLLDETSFGIPQCVDCDTNMSNQPQQTEEYTSLQGQLDVSSETNVAHQNVQTKSRSGKMLDETGFLEDFSTLPITSIPIPQTAQPSDFFQDLTTSFPSTDIVHQKVEFKPRFCTSASQCNFTLNERCLFTHSAHICNCGRGFVRHPVTQICEAKVSVHATLKLPLEQFHEDLHDTNSELYKRMRKDSITSMQLLMGENPALYATVVEVEVSGFQEGSLIVHWALVLASEKNESLAEVVHQVEKHLNEASRNEKLQEIIPLNMKQASLLSVSSGSCTADYCGDHGECQITEKGEKHCLCSGWYFGERCRISGVVMIASFSVVNVLIVLFVLWLIIFCRLERRRSSKYNGDRRDRFRRSQEFGNNFEVSSRVADAIALAESGPATVSRFVAISTPVLQEQRPPAIEVTDATLTGSCVSIDDYDSTFDRTPYENVYYEENSKTTPVTV
ncbi:uncharacterized protein LOC118198341 isoform X2 [Stegodyphus dumicola]|uniref:uncharacterized protein LOC118198341 isoform X2 n=1 Tax=Stegodyphus dumicola TaxID=202533 RepID=UPI0015B1A9BB|nr:uncharacterized protein LOC118198341 isoform X2 [Stegodyphus dumicola]